MEPVAERCPDTRSRTLGTTEGKRSSPATKVWLKIGRKCKAVELGGEKELEEKVREWMGVEREVQVYVVGWERGLSWRELAELEEGKTAEALVGLKGGMGNKKRAKKYRNPWVSAEESERKKVGSGDSSAEEIAVHKAQEAFEQLATQAMEEGGRRWR